MMNELRTKKNVRVALYSHDTMGLGHIRRNVLLATAIAKLVPDAEILLITGARNASDFSLPEGTDTLVLPTYLKTQDGKYEPRNLGNDIQRLVKMRSATIKAALDSFEPDIFIADNVPRGAMFELDSVLPVLKLKGTQLVLGLRDIIDEPEAVKKQWVKLNNAETIKKYYSSVWVYGDKNFYDITKAYELDEEVCKKIQFVGYLDALTRIRSNAGIDQLIPEVQQPYVLCCVGGGQDGAQLAKAFMQSTLPAGTKGVLLTGSMMPEEDQVILKKLAKLRGDILVKSFVHEPIEIILNAKAVISMGGYNTSMEILSCQKKALVIPRVLPRQEQWVRASRLAERGIIDCLHPDELSIENLNKWIDQIDNMGSPVKALNFNGLDTVAEIVSNSMEQEAVYS